ncbi:MAG: hypothetical protein WCH65_01425 [bacterium]
MKQQINKAATIQNIMNWANRSIGHNIDINKFNELMEKPDWEKSLKEMAESCQVEIVYKTKLEKIYFKKGNFCHKNGKIIKNLHSIHATAFFSESADVLINANGNEKQIIENFIKSHPQHQEANAYLVGSNMDWKDGGVISFPVTFYIIRRRQKKE